MRKFAFLASQGESYNLLFLLRKDCLFCHRSECYGSPPPSISLESIKSLRIFGSKKGLAEALGVHRSLISKLPDQLPTKYSDRTVGAAIRLGRLPCDRSSKGWAQPSL